MGIIEQLASQTVYSVERWRTAFAEANFHAETAGLKKEQCEQLALSCPSPEHFIHMVKLLERYAWNSQNRGIGWHILLEAVDESDYSLRDWVEALVSFSEYIEDSDGVADLKIMLGYLNCCCEANEGSVGLPLIHVLNEMLSQYGFEGGHAVLAQ